MSSALPVLDVRELRARALRAAEAAHDGDVERVGHLLDALLDELDRALARSEAGRTLCPCGCAELIAEAELERHLVDVHGAPE